MKPAVFHELLGEKHFTKVQPATFVNLTQRYRNQDAAKTVSLDKLNNAEWKSYFGLFVPFPNSFKSPLALCYHGHQFGSYNPYIGDGRGFLYAQLIENKTKRLMDLGTKGSGKTPFSRSGDGRLTLKGAFREVLASEYLIALGVNSCKILSVFETEEKLQRQDEPSPTRAAVLVRLSHSHIRIGSFQRLAYLNQHEEILKLARYVVKYYYPKLDHNIAPKELLKHLLKSLVENVAEMVAGWMSSGFVHGVLNTDNFNLTGESFDYGPWRFLVKMDFHFTAAYFDHKERYSYGKQPEAALWALCRFADCLVEFVSEKELEKELSEFYPKMQSSLFKKLCWRFGVLPPSDIKEDVFISLFFNATSKSKINLDYLFHKYYAGFEPKTLQTESKEIIPFLETLSVQKARQASRPEYFSQSLASSLSIDEVEDIWSCISERDDWTKFEKKIKIIKDYGTALRVE